MGLKITYHNPSYPKGVELGINGVGVIENGGSLVLSDAQVDLLLSERNTSLPEDAQIKKADLFPDSSFKTEKVADPEPPKMVEATADVSVTSDSASAKEGVNS